MEDNNINIEQRDSESIIEKLKSKKKTYIIALSLALVLSIAWILPQPRIYNSEVTLAPEMSSMSGGSALGDIASSLGFDMGNMETADAFYPTLYPDLLQSTTFIVGLFDVQVETKDGQIKTNYYEYLTKHQKVSFWMLPFYKLKAFIASLSEDDSKTTSTSSKIDPSRLTREQELLVENVSSKIKCTVDKKTQVISISVTDQDPLICASMADSIRMRLQNFITDYKTKKARVDVDYFEKLVKKAKREYEEALAQYSGFSDSHFNMFLESTISKKSAMNNQVQTKLSIYNTVSNQLQTAQAKLQERTPSFTIIQCATVPNKPVGPKRMLFVAGMLILTFIGTTCYILKKHLGKWMTQLLW